LENTYVARRLGAASSKARTALSHRYQRIAPSLSRNRRNPLVGLLDHRHQLLRVMGAGGRRTFCALVSMGMPSISLPQPDIERIHDDGEQHETDTDWNDQSPDARIQ
jgi:hypothetical protein